MKVISLEILVILEADVFYATEGSIRTTANKQLQSWNIAVSSASRRGVASPTGSKTVACYQTATMGTREAQYVLVGVWGIKPMNGKILQMAYWESDQFIVLMKQGNACGEKERTDRSAMDIRDTFTTHRGGV